jgi:hypothetical protein
MFRITSLIYLLLAGSSALCQAANLTNLFSTGISTNGTLLYHGKADPHWKMASGPGPGATLTNAYAVYEQSIHRSAAWLVDDTASQWIGPQASMLNFTNTGEYRYRTSFDLSGLDLDTIMLRIAVASDDQVTAVLLNDQVTGITFTNGSGVLDVEHLFNGFQSGTNTLELVVTNAGGSTGLRCVLNATGLSLLRVQPDGTSLAVNWTTNARCYALESTTNLAGGSWETNMTEPTIVNGRFQSILSAADTSRYFRLRRPPASLPSAAILVNGYLGDPEDGMGAEWVRFNPAVPACPNVGCALASGLNGQDLNTLDASSSIDWARCSTNDPALQFRWSIRFPSELSDDLYTSSRVQGWDSPVLTFPPNALPAMLNGRLWRARLILTSQVDPGLSKIYYFRFEYIGSDMEMQDWYNELNGN